jgi:hypothetical protein
MVWMPMAQYESYVLQSVRFQKRPHLFPQVALTAINENGVFVVVIYDRAITSAVFVGFLRE